MSTPQSFPGPDGQYPPAPGFGPAYPADHDGSSYQEEPRDPSAPLKDVVVKANIGISAAATAGAGASAAMIASQGAAATGAGAASASGAATGLGAASAGGLGAAPGAGMGGATGLAVGGHGGGAAVAGGQAGGAAIGGHAGGAAVGGHAGGAAIGGKAGGVAVAGGKAGGIGVGVKVGGAAVGAVVIGGAIVAGVSITGGGASQGGTIVTPPMDQGIEDFAFVGADFLTGEGTTVQLSSEADLNDIIEHPETPVEGVPYFVIGEPAYADLNGDNTLDAAVLVEPLAGGGTPSLYVWLWEDGKAVQAKSTAVVGMDCGDRIEDFSGQDDTIQVDVTTGQECSADSKPYTETFSLAVQDGFPVQVEPVFGAPTPCSSPLLEVTGEGTGDTVAVVAPHQDAPPVGDSGEFTRIEVLNRQSYPSGWNLARLTRDDDTVSCGWVKQ